MPKNDSTCIEYISIMDQESFLLALDMVHGPFPYILGLTNMLLGRCNNMWWETQASHRLNAILNGFVGELICKANYNVI